MSSVVGKPPRPSADSEAKSIEASSSYYFALQRKRSKWGSSIQKPYLVLPQLPRRPVTPVTHITHKDLDIYLKPLLSNNWHVAVRKDAFDREILSMNKLFTIKDPESNTAFLDSLAQISKQENHHALITTDSASDIYVAVHTHQARVQHPDPVTGQLSTTKLPGLTLRDVRWAIQVENLHKEFLADGRAITTVPRRAAWMRQQSMQRLQREYPAVHIDTEGNEGHA
ncbi:hypothetical protein F5I97DRAFT_1925469 [Phlebopus sp. FC_14]|nr:hypothetical protein F5I97DRAFT_1925469 [Phlebopus sp. FC_14]